MHISGSTHIRYSALSAMWQRDARDIMILLSLMTDRLPIRQMKVFPSLYERLEGAGLGILETGLLVRLSWSICHPLSVRHIPVDLAADETCEEATGPMPKPLPKQCNIAIQLANSERLAVRAERHTDDGLPLGQGSSAAA